jgi:hypothetical protein
VQVKRLLASLSIISLAVVGLSACGDNGAVSAGLQKGGSAEGAFAWQPELVVAPDEALFVEKDIYTERDWWEVEEKLRNEPDPETGQAQDAQIYLDPALKVPFDTSSVFTNGGGYRIIPGNHIEGQSLYSVQLNLLEDLPEEERWIELFDANTWGVFSTFYLMQRTDKKGRILEKPEVTPIRVEGREDLPTPEVRYRNGHAEVTIGDLGDGVEELVLAKAQASKSPKTGARNLKVYGFRPAAEDMRDGNVIDLWQPANLAHASARYADIRANQFLKITDIDETDELSINVYGHDTKMPEEAAGYLFTMVKKDGTWQTSALRPLNGISPRIPVNILNSPKFLEQFYGSAVIAPNDFPDGLPAIAGDGYIRSFAADAKRVDANYLEGVAVEFSIRDSSLRQVLSFSDNPEDGSVDEMIERVNSYDPPTDGIPEDIDASGAAKTWTAVPEKPIEIPDHIFGTTEMSRYIAAHMEQGYTEIDLSAFPESSTKLQVRSAIIEAVSQNPLILGEQLPQHDSDETSKILQITPRLFEVLEGTPVFNERRVLETREEFLAIQSEVKKKAEQAVAEIISNGMTDREKADAIDDWLAQNTIYTRLSDVEREEILARGDEAGPEQIAALSSRLEVDTIMLTLNVHPHQTAAGPLLEGGAICTGYAEAFQLLAMEAGLQSITVSGITGSNGHAWNKVNIDGTWLNYDPTWNDQGDESIKRFSALTDQEIVGEVGDRAFVWPKSIQEPFDKPFRNF